MPAVSKDEETNACMQDHASSLVRSGIIQDWYIFKDLAD